MARMDVVSRIQSMIQVKPVKDSRLVNIVIEDRNPDRAALLANG